MKNLLVLWAVVSASAFGLIEVGDFVPNMCWKDAQNQETCLNASTGKIRVLLYNAGWCPPCQSEFLELKTAVHEFDNEPVQFLSLSSEGWTRGSPPSPQFLEEWKTRYEISFPVLASPKDAGKKFFSQIYIPNVAVLDRENKLIYKAINPGVHKLFEVIREHL